jgi:phage terminase small subunit
MPATKKRTAINTTAGAVDMFKSAQFSIAPPSMLTRDIEKMYFGQITRSREAATWSELDITNAALLSITLAQLQDSNESIARDGITTKNDRGTPVISPWVSAKSQLAAQVLSLQRSLGLSASQRGAASGEQRQRNSREIETRAVLEATSKNSLLAGFDDDLL